MGVYRFLVALAVVIGLGLICERLVAREPSGDAAGGLSYPQLAAQLQASRESGAPAEQRVQLIRRWLSDKTFADLEPETLAVLLDHLLPWDKERRGFEVEWAGYLTAPRSGEYRFSASPLDVSSGNARSPVQAEMEVRINGQVVLSAKAGEWRAEGEPVTLKGDEPTPIRVVFRYTNTKRNRSLADPAVAVLSWKGPGLPQQVITEQSFRVAANGDRGLTETIKWREGDVERQSSRRRPNVEAVWLHGAQNVAPPDPQLVREIVDHLSERLASPRYLAGVEAAADGLASHLVFRDPLLASRLGRLAQKQIIEQCLARRDQLSGVSREDAVNAFLAMRCGAQEEALELLGAWMTEHADDAPAIAEDFFGENRREYGDLGVALAQAPGQVEVIADNCLETESGGCVLPAAYALTYARLAEDRARPLPEKPTDVSVSTYREWVERLDEKLADESLTGERRVNWLLARAQANEARGARFGSSGSGRVREDYHAGLEWITEGQLVAEEDATGARLLLEKAARLATVNREAELRETLARAQGLVPQAELQEWRRRIQAIKQARLDRVERQATLRRSAYLNEIKRRRERAAQSGDETLLARYDAILERAGAPADENQQ